ncbi:MAG: pyridoxamine 5'-phosphate oxidase [Sandaracinaceae bacterium]|nr:pyridoxamine 5'-phosphate oxidase [Sandaracinaceae bacterium]
MSLFLAERDRARAMGEPWDAASAALATVDSHGAPSVRFVLVKHASPEGLRFFTNRESDKGRQLANDPRAALAFHFVTTGVQLRYEGRVTPLSDAESDVYFAERPRISQLGAWASSQSRPLASRAELEARLHEQEKRFEGGDVPRPPHWGGYVLVPERAEHWNEGAFRLHDRVRFEREGSAWKLTRLNP